MDNSKAFNRFFYIALALLGIVYIIGMFLPLMDVDATNYAELSKQMLQSGSYLQVFLNGRDYLDKPPLLFWITCLFFKIFGIHDWAYRLPSLLCLVLGLYSLYRYTRLFYTEQSARLAVLIMASCTACYIMTSDVRTDTMLTGWVIFSIWQFAEFNRSLKIKNILLATVGVGCAMLTKGPIGLIVPLTAFALEFAYKREWKNFFRWQYFLAIAVIAILLLPMSYGLYEQFDLHPEKHILDHPAHTSGLRFYYWTQSFGRITGESSWNNDPDPFFLYHSFLWSFAPWSLFFIAALFTRLKNIFKNFKQHSEPEIASVAGFVIILIFLSLSKYQLPHYSFVIHPLAAIVTATYLDTHFISQKRSSLFSVFSGLHMLTLMAIFGIAFLIPCFIFPSMPFLVIPSLGLIAFIYIMLKWETKFPKIYALTLVPFLTLALILNTLFYPQVLKYQVGTEMVRKLANTAPADSKVLIYKDYHGFGMQFYSKFPIVEYVYEKDLKDNLVKGKTYILADSAEVKGIQTIEPEISVIGKYYGHSPTRLDWKFLNPATRNSVVDHDVLMHY